MNKTEYYMTRADGVELNRTYSDRGMKIRKVGTDEVYDEAVDVDGTGYQYEETDIPVDTAEEDETDTVDENAATAADYIGALQELGVEV